MEKEKHKNSMKKIEEKKKELEMAMSCPNTCTSLIQSINSERKLLETKKQTDVLQLGDKNSGYFHAISRNCSRLSQTTNMK